MLSDPDVLEDRHRWAPMDGPTVNADGQVLKCSDFKVQIAFGATFLPHLHVSWIGRIPLLGTEVGMGRPCPQAFARSQEPPKDSDERPDVDSPDGPDAESFGWWS